MTQVLHELEALRKELAQNKVEFNALARKTRLAGFPDDLIQQLNKLNDHYHFLRLRELELLKS